jgi:hypothetical protein
MSSIVALGSSMLWRRSNIPAENVRGIAISLEAASSEQMRKRQVLRMRIHRVRTVCGSWFPDIMEKITPDSVGIVNESGHLQPNLFNWR